jgi:hypothetical protein
MHIAGAGNGHTLHVHTAGVGKGYTLQFRAAGGENWKEYPLHVQLQTTDSGKVYTLYVHRRLVVVLFLLYEVEKSEVNEGIPEKISPATALLPVVKSGIGIPASGSVRYLWSLVTD